MDDRPKTSAVLAKTLLGLLALVVGAFYLMNNALTPSAAQSKVQSSHRCACGKTQTTTAFRNQVSYIRWRNLALKPWTWITRIRNGLTNTAIDSVIGRRSRIHTTHNWDAGRGMFS